MRQYLSILDDFFERPSVVRRIALGLNYKDEVSPSDGLVYHNIAFPVPPIILQEIQVKLAYVYGCGVDVKMSYLRLSPKGSRPKYWVHTDPVLAENALIAYLNTPEQCRGGTAILEHKSGLSSSPVNEAEEKTWRRDANNMNNWDVVTSIRMKYNRAFCMSSYNFHAALPRGGFGQDVNDGRLILAVFYNLLEA